MFLYVILLNVMIVKSELELIYANPESNVTMSCRGGPSTKWRGMLYDYDLSNDTVRLNDYHDLSVTVIHSIDSNWNNITLTRVIEHHGGTYTCKDGNYTIKYILTVFNSFPPITNRILHIRAVNRVFLSCNLYRFDNDTGYVNWLVDSDKNGTFSYIYHDGHFVSDRRLNYEIRNDDLIILTKISGIYACYKHIIVDNLRLNLEILYNVIN